MELCHPRLPRDRSDERLDLLRNSDEGGLRSTHGRRSVGVQRTWTWVTYPAPSSDGLGKIIGFCGGAGSRTLGTQIGILEASRGFATEAAELAAGSALPAGSVSFRLTASKSMSSDNALTTDLLSLAHGRLPAAAGLKRSGYSWPFLRPRDGARAIFRGPGRGFIVVCQRV